MALVTGCWVLDAALVLLTAAAIFLMHAYSYWWLHGVPFIWPIPVVGNLGPMFLLRGSPGVVLADLYTKTPGRRFTGFYQMWKPSLLLRDPEIIRHVIVKDYAHFDSRGVYFDERIDPLSGHLFNLGGERWRVLRSKLNPAFTLSKIKTMFACVHQCGKEFRKQINIFAESEQPFEVRDIVARYATDVIASCAFGIESNSLKDPEAEFRTYGRMAFEPTIPNLFRLSIWSLFPEFGPILKVSNFSPKVTTFFNRVVMETVRFREKNGVSRNDFLQLLIHMKCKQAADGDSSTKRADLTTVGLTDNEIAAQAFIFYLAGFETSSASMTFCLYELALHPEIQDRVRSEVEDVLERHGDELTYEGIHEMEYLDRVLYETMRKYPPVPVLNRACTKRYRLPESDVVVHEGVSIIVPTLGLHYDPVYFPDPERFDPERFTEEAVKTRPRYAYLPFGAGPRLCVGQLFAMLQMKMMVASIISEYRVEMCSKTQNPMKLDPISFPLVPAGGLWLVASPR